MGFELNVWRNYYNSVTAIGAVVKANVREFQKTGSCELSREEIDKMIIHASAICTQSADYLTKNGIPPLKPLWDYCIKDETTWASSDKFEYGHLLKKE